MTWPAYEAAVPLIIALFLNMGIALILAMEGYRHRSAVLARIFVCMISGVFLWSFIYAIQLGIADIALQFALALPHVSTTLIGTSTARHVMRALDLLGAPVDGPLLDEVLDLVRPVANVCWQEGRPENFDPGARPQQS